jgi:large subunit ribosomal protein L31
MKPNIHPVQNQVLAKCICGNEFYFDSALDSEVIHLEVCNKCHPFFTGKQQVVKVAGRVENFASKFANFKDKQRKIMDAAAASQKAKPAAKKTSKSKATAKKATSKKASTNE